MRNVVSLYSRYFALVVLGIIFTITISRVFVVAQSPDTDSRVRPTLKGTSPRAKKRCGIRNNVNPDKEAVSNEEDVVRVDTSLIVCDVLVLDKQGKAVHGLTPSDFTVAEDDKQQKIESFSSGDNEAIPRSIVLIMDYSGSLTPFLNTSIEGAKELVEKLGPKDTMAIVTDDLTLLADFTRDKTELKLKLESLKEKAKAVDARGGWYRGHSLQFSALLATLREMFDEEDVRPIVIFQTDGDEFEILQPVSDPSHLSIARQFSLRDVYEEAEKSRATIYAVIPGIRFAGLSEKEQQKQAIKDTLARTLTNDPKVLSRVRGRGISSDSAKSLIENRLRRQLAVVGVTELTGGQTEFLEDPSQAQEIYSRILASINRRYVIGYYPTNKAHDGKRRSVKVEVLGHPEYTVWGRKSYYACGPGE